MGEGDQEITTPKSLEEAVVSLTDTNDPKSAIAYLRGNPDDITEFCIQMLERYPYQKGDKTGVIQLGMMIKELLAEEEE